MDFGKKVLEEVEVLDLFYLLVLEVLEDRKDQWCHW